MSITLDSLAFDETQTTVREKHEEVGGRDGRTIEITGVVSGEATLGAVEERLDAILQAASSEDYAQLCLRPGRRLWARRQTFTREVNAAACVGVFTLVLETKAPYEESVAVRATEWLIDSQHAQLAVETEGNMPTPATITVQALGPLVDPSFSDGVRIIQYAGVVDAGSVLVLDGVEARTLLNGEDVTAYTTGIFPHVAPGGATLRWSDADSSSHSASASVQLRDRWW